MLLPHVLRRLPHRHLFCTLSAPQTVSNPSPAPIPDGAPLHSDGAPPSPAKRPLRAPDLRIILRTLYRDGGSLADAVADVHMLRYSARCLQNFAKGYKELPDAWFTTTAANVHAGTYKFGPIHRQFLPGISRTKERRWAEQWGNFGDLVVAQALHAALVHLLDKDFLPTSHGGRLKGSPHTALHHVFTHFGRGVRWVVRGQWPRCRDLIPVAALQAAADRHLAGDPRGLALVRAALQVPVNHARKFGALCEPLEEGVPRSNPIYAPAVNMLFHPVDELVADLAAEHSRGRFVHKAHLIREHAALQAACEAVKVPIPAKAPVGNNTFAIETPLPTPESLAPLQALMERHAPPGGVDMGAGYGLQGYQHIEYARYLDEFVIGIAADDDGQLAQRVFEAVQMLCVSKLQLDPDGVQLLPFSDKGVSWLHTRTCPSPVHRRESTGVHLELPYSEVLQALRIKGYLQGAHRRGRSQYIVSSHKGDSYGPLVTKPHAHILAYFNQRLHGLTALYSCVANKAALRGVLFHVKQCVACTFANKYKLQSMGKTYQKFGLRLTDPWTNTTLHNVNAAATGPAMFEMEAPMPNLDEVLTAPQTQRCMAAGSRYRTNALKGILQRRRGKYRLPNDWSPVDDGFAGTQDDSAG